jgi:hypothetical protein
MLKEKGYSTDNSSATLLDREIDSWKGYEYALREENATLFNKF